ncbi:MAG: SDR family oxidoreductase [Bacteroidota bacterium]
MKQKIFISGGSQGIGLAIARKFYQENFDVIICARGKEGLERAKAEMPLLHTISCDISDKTAVKALAEQLNQEFGALDILINNGGTYQPGQLHAEEDEVYETMMRTNMDSAYYLTKGVIGAMIARKQGMVVNMCSVASLTAYANGGAYSVSKFALLGFSKNLREEMKEHGIGVVSIMPGAVKTPSWDGVDVPAERLMPPEDIAEIIWNACTVSRRTVVEDIVVRPFLGDL